MAKTTRSVAKRARHKKWLKRAKGFRGRRSTVFKIAKEAVIKSGQYAYRDRRKKKTEFRTLWQLHINAAVRPLGLSYSKFIAGLRVHQIGLNRKVMAELAQSHPATFASLVEKAKATK
jgi:large subunit ribosomal protein L20